MGKRKQKVRWCIVDGLDWNNGNEEEGSGGEGAAGAGMAAVKGGETGGKEGRRSSGGREGWGGSLAPRFERKAAAAEQKHIYYEGEYCEAEELPNGFTKIRSKNLDILFKRDYYEQRLAIQRLNSEQLAEKEAAEAEEGGGETEEVGEFCFVFELAKTKTIDTGAGEYRRRGRGGRRDGCHCCCTSSSCSDPEAGQVF